MKINTDTLSNFLRCSVFSLMCSVKTQIIVADGVQKRYWLLDHGIPLKKKRFTAGLICCILLYSTPLAMYDNRTSHYMPTSLGVKNLSKNNPHSKVSPEKDSQERSCLISLLWTSSWKRRTSLSKMRSLSCFPLHNSRWLDNFFDWFWGENYCFVQQWKSCGIAFLLSEGWWYIWQSKNPCKSRTTSGNYWLWAKIVAFTLTAVKIHVEFELHIKSLASVLKIVFNGFSRSTKKNAKILKISNFPQKLTARGAARATIIFFSNLQWALI